MQQRRGPTSPLVRISPNPACRGPTSDAHPPSARRVRPPPWASAAVPTSAGTAIVLLGDQTPVAAEYRVRHDDACHLTQDPPAEFLASHHESTALGVGQAKRSRTKVLPEDAILLSEIVDEIFLVAIHPPSQGQHEEVQSVGHGLRLRGSGGSDTIVTHVVSGIHSPRPFSRTIREPPARHSTAVHTRLGGTRHRLRSSASAVTSMTRAACSRSRRVALLARLAGMVSPRVDRTISPVEMSTAIVPAAAQVFRETVVHAYAGLLAGTRRAVLLKAASQIVGLANIVPGAPMPA